jgi:hypothetical protein
MDEIIKITFVVLFIMVIIFFVTRWFWCWYFKINHRLNELEKTNEILKDIRILLMQQNQIQRVQTQEVVNMSDQMINGVSVNASPNNISNNAAVRNTSVIEEQLPEL